METAVATPTVPFLLRDVEDLHDVDLDGVLADALLDAGVAVVAANVVADLVGGPGLDGMFAHTLSARALFLAVL